MTARAIVLVGVAGVVVGIAVAELIPRPRAAATPPAATTTTTTTPAAPEPAPARTLPALPARPVSTTAPDEPFDRVDENGDPIIQHGRFAGWTYAQWHTYYGERLEHMRAELREAEDVLARDCAAATATAAAAAETTATCRDAVANARVQTRDLRLRIERDERDLASAAQAR